MAQFRHCVADRLDLVHLVVFGAGDRYPGGLAAVVVILAGTGGHRPVADLDRVGTPGDLYYGGVAEMT